MKRIYLLVFSVGLLLVGSIRLTPTAHAQPQATYELVQSYSGPGGSGSAGIYDVSSSIGQPTAGEVSAGSEHPRRRILGWRSARACRQQV